MKAYAQKQHKSSQQAFLSPQRSSSIGVQRKLKINTPGDIYEREADRVAAQVTSLDRPTVQPVCACGGGCRRCQREKDTRKHVQWKSVQANDIGEIEAPSVVDEVLLSSGQPLDSSMRASMESRFGHDFSGVRVHTDARAVHGASVLGARAFTVGDHIGFGAGEYAPLLESGQSILAHELAHVVQQRHFDQPLGVFRKETNGTSAPTTPGEKSDESRLEDLLVQITERMINNLELKCKLDSLPQNSSEQRKILGAALNTGHMDLIGLLQQRIILLQLAIADLGSRLTRTAMPSSAEDLTAESVFFHLDRYNHQLQQHQAQLKPLLRWQTRQKVDSLQTEIAMIDEELGELPPVSDSQAPEANMLATRRAELLMQRKTLVGSLTSGAVEFKQSNKKWGKINYGQSKDCSSIAEGGCGPTSLAILLNYLYGQDPEALTTDDIYFVTPAQTAEYAETHGRICGKGTNAQTMVTQVSTQWPGYRGKSIKLEQAITELRGGNLVIFTCHSCTGKKANGKEDSYTAHILVLSGVDDAGTTFNVLDPGGRDFKTISKKELKTKAGGFWIVERK